MELSWLALGLGQDQTQWLRGYEAVEGEEGTSAGTHTNFHRPQQVLQHSL